MDPAAFRRMNLVGPGDEDAVGRSLRVAAVRQVLDAALAAGRWGEPKARPGHGKGIAIFGRQIGGGASGVVLTAEADGTFTVLSPTVDVGTGTHTIEQQIVATEMDVPLSWVRVRQGDTDSTPFDEGPRASRVTYTEGHAVLQACAHMRQARHAGATLPLTITIEHNAPQPEDVMYFSAHVAEVDVDRETGQVKVLKVVTAHDVGTVINPLAHQGQIDGGFVTGFGLAVTEELVSEAGQILNGHLGEYKLPTIADIPPLETVLVPTSGGAGPYQAKAIGELANNATAAAIANAVADAVGCRLFELPITAERVYTALHQVERPETA
jgi:CO/xanthine dehydrogenase Mo-binding subunit